MIDFEITHSDNITRYAYNTHYTTYSAAFYYPLEKAILYRSSMGTNSWIPIAIQHYIKGRGWAHDIWTLDNIEIFGLTLEEIKAVIMLDQL